MIISVEAVAYADRESVWAYVIDSWDLWRMIKTPAIAFVALALIRACGEDTEPTVEAPQASAFALSASHGGSVLFVENGWVEVVPKSDGVIEAYVVDTAGAPLAAPMTASVSVKVNGDDGATHDVVLPWNPVSARFEGRLVDARPAPGPVEVVIMRPGQPQWRAVAPTVIIVAAPMPPVSAAPVVIVERPRAEVQVRGPNVVIEAPRVSGPTIVIEERRGRRGRRGRRDHHEHGVVVVAPHPPSFVIAPPHPGVIVIQPGGRGHPGRGHGGGRGGGRGRGRGRD